MKHFALSALYFFGPENTIRGILTTNNLFVFQKERMESVGILKQSLSVLTKSDKNDVELSFCRRQKLRFSSRFQRKCDYEIVSVDLLKEAFENLYDVLSHVAQMKNKI